MAFQLAILPILAYPLLTHGILPLSTSARTKPSLPTITKSIYKTTVHSLAQRSDDLYALRLPLTEQEGYLALYLSNTTAVPFCNGVANDDTEPSLRHLFILYATVENSTIRFPVHTDLATAFCSKVREHENVSTPTTTMGPSISSTVTLSTDAEFSLFSSTTSTTASGSGIGSSTENTSSTTRQTPSSTSESSSSAKTSSTFRSSTTSSTLLTSSLLTSTLLISNILSSTPSPEDPPPTQTPSSPSTPSTSSPGSTTFSSRKEVSTPSHSTTSSTSSTPTTSSPSSFLSTPQKTTVVILSTSIAPSQSWTSARTTTVLLTTSTAPTLHRTWGKAEVDGSVGKVEPTPLGKVLLMGSDDGDDETQEEEMEDEGQEELGKTGAAKGKGGKSEKVDGGAKNTEKAGKKGDEEKETGEEDADEEETTERKDNHKADGKAKEDAEGEGEKSGAHPRFAASADKRIMVLVYIMWTLFVLQIVMGFWNFGRHLREDWVVRGYRL